MHRDVTLVAIKSSNKNISRKLKTAKKLLYNLKRSFQLGDKNFRVIYTLTFNTKFINYTYSLTESVVSGS